MIHDTWCLTCSEDFEECFQPVLLGMSQIFSISRATMLE
jgi:hypothetical protein